MIKNDELKRLRAEAERTGDSHDLWKLIEALEGRLDSPHSALLHDPYDAERTIQTAAAHAEAREDIERIHPGGVGPVQIVHTMDGPYVAEIRGQASATAHGFQGFSITRGELLRSIEEAGVPVLLAFKDGGVWQTAWLSELPPPQALKRSTSREDARSGWYAGEKPERGEPLFKRSEHLELPIRIEPRPRAQEELV